MTKSPDPVVLKTIADATLKLWQEHRREITLEEIAKASGKSTSTVYYYKPALLEAELLVDHDGKLYPPGLWEHIGEFFEIKIKEKEEVDAHKLLEISPDVARIDDEAPRQDTELPIQPLEVGSVSH